MFEFSCENTIGILLTIVFMKNLDIPLKLTTGDILRPKSSHANNLKRCNEGEVHQPPTMCLTPMLGNGGRRKKEENKAEERRRLK